MPSNSVCIVRSGWQEMKAMPLTQFQPHSLSLSHFWQDKTSIQLSGLIMFHACALALTAVLSHFTPLWYVFVSSIMTGRKRLSTSGALMPPWCQRRGSTPRSYILNCLNKPSCIVSPLSAESDAKWWPSIHFDWRTMLHNGPRVEHMHSQPKEGSQHNGDALKRRLWIKRWPDVSIFAVTSLQIRAHGDNAPLPAREKQCVSVAWSMSASSFVYLCERSRLLDCDWKLSRVFLPLWKNTSDSWPGLAYTIRYGCNRGRLLTCRQFSLHYWGQAESPRLWTWKYST